MKPRRRAPLNSQSEDGGFSIEALRTLREEAGELRAEQLLQRVKRLANQFIEERERTSPSPDALLDFEQSIRQRLFSFNPAARIARVEPHLISFRFTEASRLPRIQWPYGFKGGAARVALESVLFPDMPSAPRDIDLVRFGRGQGGLWERRDKQMAERHMEEDHRHGHGVEVLDSIDQYLRSRDLTRNEVVLANGLLTCSRECIEDYLSGILRPSLRYRAEVPAAVALKAARLAASAGARGRDVKLVGFPQSISPTSFELALQLGRALEEGEGVARKFVSLVIESGLMTPQTLGGSSVAAVMRKLNLDLSSGVRSVKK